MSSGDQDRILLVGAGYVAARLGVDLVRAGHEVWGLRRSERQLPEGIRALRGDVVTGAGLEQLPERIAQLVYAVSPGERSAAAYRAAYVEGLRHLCQRLPEARVLLVSSTAVYGPGDPAWVDEETPPNPIDEASAQLALGERELLESRTAPVILRASGIYGPGRTQLLARLAHQPLDAEDGSHLSSRIHRDDLARTLHFFIDHPELAGIYNASDTESASWSTIQAWLAERPIPSWLTAPNTSVSGRTRRSSGRAVSSKKLQGLGFRFSYPTFREGYAALLEQGPEAPLPEGPPQNPNSTSTSSSAAATNGTSSK